MSDSDKTRIIKANYMLQAKVGKGPLDERVVKKMEEVMQQNTIDFYPLAMEYLDDLKNAIEKTRNGEYDHKQAAEEFTTPVMEIKSNAATFKYDLVGRLANVMMTFLESFDEIDEDVIDIVEAHHKTLTAIISKRMSGDGGQSGKILEDELKAACARYKAKKKESP